MRYWRYRAYDANFRIYDGVTTSNDFVNMAVKLRQNGLQLIDASIIDSATYRAELRLEHHRRLLAVIANTNEINEIKPYFPNTQISESLIHRIMRKLLNYFR